MQQTRLHMTQKGIIAMDILKSPWDEIQEEKT